MTKPMMKCGHAANATTGADFKTPVCVICFPDPGSIEIDQAPPDFTGRRAQCAYCKSTQPSSPSLAFFGHRPDKEFDSFYDGCIGWD